MAEVLGFEPPSGLAEAPAAPTPLPFDDEPAADAAPPEETAKDETVH
jgi:hypothetical protein